VTRWIRASWPNCCAPECCDRSTPEKNGLRTLRELARSYQTISKDLKRVMNRLKALFRSWGIPCAGTRGHAPSDREHWLNKIAHAGVRRRAELFYQHLDGLQILRRQVRGEFLAESRKHKAVKGASSANPEGAQSTTVLSMVLDTDTGKTRSYFP